MLVVDSTLAAGATLFSLIVGMELSFLLGGKFEAPVVPSGGASAAPGRGSLTLMTGLPEAWTSGVFFMGNWKLARVSAAV